MSESHSMKDLETKIKVVSDHSELDFILNHDWYSYNEEIGQAMEVITEITQMFKDNIEAGIEFGTELIADRDRSMQEYYLARNSNLASMQLINNIIFEEMGKNEYIIGPDVGHFYPLCVEYGRKEVRPVNPNVKFLRWETLSGVVVYSKYSSATEPSPFMAPAFEDMVNNAEEILRRSIDSYTNF